MYLVDTSVLIDFLKGVDTVKSRKFEEILQVQIPFAISVFTYQEVLQGARDTKEYDKLNNYLSTQNIIYPEKDCYEKAAKLFFTCRKSGITIRSTIDTLIATTAIKNNLILLHSDKDFDNMAGVVGLRVE
jgi:predicted nucleic acid-binding protein